MKLLGDYDDGRLSEDLARAHNRIKGPEAGIVAVESLCRGSSLNRLILHLLRFVSAHLMVTADDQVFDFPRTIQLRSRLDAMIKKRIPVAAVKGVSSSPVPPLLGGSAHSASPHISLRDWHGSRAMTRL